MGGRLLLGSASLSCPVASVHVLCWGSRSNRQRCWTAVPTSHRGASGFTAARDLLDPSAEEVLLTQTDVRRTRTRSAAREKFRSV